MYKAPLIAAPLFETALAVDAPAAADDRPIPPPRPGDQPDFLALSVALTGFDEVELRGTGVVADYHGWLEEHFAGQLAGLLELWRETPPGEAALESFILRDPDAGPFARALIVLWYTATWSFAGQPTVAFRKAFPEGLIWKTGDLHPTAAKPPGFASWALPPAAKPPEVIA